MGEKIFISFFPPYHTKMHNYCFNVSKCFDQEIGHEALSSPERTCACSTNLCFRGHGVGAALSPTELRIKPPCPGSLRSSSARSPRGPSREQATEQASPCQPRASGGDRAAGPRQHVWQPCRADCAAPGANALPLYLLNTDCYEELVSP